jgi:pilus assembly protein CpaB
MKRQHRTLIVLAIAVTTAGLASLGVYRAIQRIPVREVEVASTHIVVAAQPLPVGTRLEANHLRLAAWPTRTPVPGAFTDPQALVNRGVLSQIGENEPITASKVASPEAGAGLPPVIPAGMRAVSVRVNEVIGVAGFVVPGTRVDLVVTVKDPDESSGRQQAMSRTVVSNVAVLTAGTKFDQEKAKDGKPVPTTVVTLMVLPEDAERIALASNEGKITLALRNPLDVQPTATRGIRLPALMRGTGPEPVVDPVKHVVVARKPSPTPPPAPFIYRVETIRAAKRAEEVVR